MPVIAKALQFSKYQGLGNDFILVDNRGQQDPLVSEQQAIKLCDRNFGIGADGVIFALPPVGDVDYTMRIFNSDGTEPEMCGNGIRCLAKFVAARDQSTAAQYTVHTNGGIMRPTLLSSGDVCVDMGEPILEGPAVPTNLPQTQGSTVVGSELEIDGLRWGMTCVSMGNPHAVTYGYSKDGTYHSIKVDELNIFEIGPKFESHPVFPAKTNTEFVEVLSPEHVRMVVWERGAGRTLACGTGACATVVAGVLEGKTSRNCRVDLPGGPLHIEWRESDNHVYMTGPAELAFEGQVTL